jgi:hypothetical protein
MACRNPSCFTWSALANSLLARVLEALLSESLVFYVVGVWKSASGSSSGSLDVEIPRVLRGRRLQPDLGLNMGVPWWKKFLYIFDISLYFYLCDFDAFFDAEKGSFCDPFKVHFGVFFRSFLSMCFRSLFSGRLRAKK